MRFAVVEYTSKTGRVWQHTAERPNYLADPQAEIDPTSFGCYVSALEGEHIPLTSSILAGPKPLALVRRIYRRLTGWWPPYSIRSFAAFDALMVVHQLSNAHELVAFLRRLKQQYPHICVIGVPTQPFGVLQEELAHDRAAEQHLRDFMDACDVFMALVKDTQSWYAARTTTPVVYLPQAYPAAYASQHLVPLSQKTEAIVVAGVTQRPDVRKGQHVAVALQQQFPQLEILIPKVSEFEYDFTGLAGARYTVLPFEQWQTHLRTLGRVKLVINTDYTHTRGRVQTDCAAVGTPSIGANSDGQHDLFPELASTPETTVAALVAQAARLLTDPALYQQTVAAAHERLRKYDYAESADRIRLLVRMYKPERPPV